MEVMSFGKPLRDTLLPRSSQAGWDLLALLGGGGGRRRTRWQLRLRVVVTGRAGLRAQWLWAWGYAAPAGGSSVELLRRLRHLRAGFSAEAEREGQSDSGWLLTVMVGA